MVLISVWETAGWRCERSWHFHSNMKAGKILMSQLKHPSRRSLLFFEGRCQAVCSNESMRATRSREGNLFHLIYPPCSNIQFSSVTQSCPTLQPHESQHARLPYPSPTPRVHSNSCPLSQWCHPAISSSVVPFSSCPQSLPASGSFPMSQLFTWGGQSTGVSALASFLPKKSQGWSPSEWTGWISLQSKGLVDAVKRGVFIIKMSSNM